MATWRRCVHGARGTVPHATQGRGWRAVAPALARGRSGARDSALEVGLCIAVPRRQLGPSSGKGRNGLLGLSGPENAPSNQVASGRGWMECVQRQRAVGRVIASIQRTDTRTEIAWSGNAANLRLPLAAGPAGAR